jgi:hypothetical protein
MQEGRYHRDIVVVTVVYSMGDFVYWTSTIFANVEYRRISFLSVYTVSSQSDSQTVFRRFGKVATVGTEPLRYFDSNTILKNVNFIIHFETVCDFE